MEIEFHPEAWPQLLHRSADHGAALPPLDWPGLRARLIAAHALRAETASLARPAGAACASFNRMAAEQLCALSEGSHLINPSASANGKSRCAINADIDGASAPGDRGLV